MKSLSQALVSQSLLDAVSQTAAESPRRRMNRNFHDTNEAPCHRLLNAIEPGSYIQPHRHLDPNKEESIIVLRGAVGVVFFDDAGQVLGTARLVPGGENVAVNIPVGAYHSVLGLEPGTVFFEAKAGPYLPLLPAEKAPWAPGEGDAGAETYYAGLLAQVMKA
ncbi:MAG: WbuC family cupin fold metalloprotein [Sulfuricellaceae bacterium]